MAKKPKSRNVKNVLYKAGFVTLRIRGGKYLVLDSYINGTRKFETFGRQFILTGNDAIDVLLIEEAKKVCVQREAELQAKGFAWLLRKKVKVNFLAFFERVAKEKNVKPFHNCLAHLKRFEPAKKWLLADITSADVTAFQNYLVNLRLSANTVHTYMANIKTAFGVARREKLLNLNHDPFSDVPPVKRHDSRRTYLTFDEIKRLSETDCQDNHVKRAFLLSCFCGLRVSDVRALTWRNVQNDRIEIIMAKTGEPFHADLNATATAQIGKRGKAAINDAVFTLPEEKQVGRILLRWAKAAGVEKHVTFHVSRHTYATLLITYGNDIFVTSELLGHKDVKVTRKYAKIVNERKQAAINSLPVL
jgi:integrase